MMVLENFMVTEGRWMGWRLIVCVVCLVYFDVVWFSFLSRQFFFFSEKMDERA